MPYKTKTLAEARVKLITMKTQIKHENRVQINKICANKNNFQKFIILSLTEFYSPKINDFCIFAL